MKIRILVRFCLIPLCLFLAACGSEVLYSNLEESEANKILGLLMARNIPATKQVLKGELFSVFVPKEKFPEAVDLLEWYGIPKQQYSGVGTVFQKTGMVSTPSEEKIRYTYALSEDVAEMLNQIDGVVTARVQLVLPENDPYNNESTPSSASVFLKFRPGDVPATLEPQVKQLVMNSVPGLSYDKVAVTVMQSESLDLYYPIKSPVPESAFFGLRVDSSSLGPLRTLVVVLVVVCLVAVGAAVYFYIKLRRRAAATKAAAESEDTTEEQVAPSR